MIKLKAYTYDDMIDGKADIDVKYYTKEDADTAIATLQGANEEKAGRIVELQKQVDELNDKCNMHNFFWEGCGFAKRGFKNTIAVSEALDRLEAENRKLKRVLWLDKAARANAEWGHWATIWFCDTRAILNINKSSVSQDPYRCTITRNAAEWRNLWAEVERKCRAKAEEYK